MALGSTQPLTEMSARNFPGDRERPARKADDLTAICEPIAWKMWEPRRLTTLWAFTPCYEGNVTFTFMLCSEMCCNLGLNMQGLPVYPAIDIVSLSASQTLHFYAQVVRTTIIV
jgi:hypothetical protein